MNKPEEIHRAALAASQAKAAAALGRVAADIAHQRRDMLALDAEIRAHLARIDHHALDVADYVAAVRESERFGLGSGLGQAGLCRLECGLTFGEPLGTAAEEPAQAGILPLEGDDGSV